MRYAFVAIAVVCFGCGAAPDPRASFVGVWKGGSSTAVTFGAKTTNSSGEETLTVANSSDGGKIIVTAAGDGCVYKATPKDSTSFSVETGGCSTNQDGCTLTTTVTSGSGTRVGNNLKFVIAANVGVSCSDGTSGAGTVAWTVDATKQ